MLSMMMQCRSETVTRYWPLLEYWSEAATSPTSTLRQMILMVVVMIVVKNNETSLTVIHTMLHSISGDS